MDHHRYGYTYSQPSVTAPQPINYVPNDHAPRQRGVHVNDDPPAQSGKNAFLEDRVRELQRLLSESEQNRKEERSRLMNEHWERVKTLEDSFRGREDELSQLKRSYAQALELHASEKSEFQKLKEHLKQHEILVRDLSQRVEQKAHAMDELRTNLSKSEHEILMLRSQLEDKETIIRMQREILENNERTKRYVSNAVENISIQRKPSHSISNVSQGNEVYSHSNSGTPFTSTQLTKTFSTERSPLRDRQIELIAQSSHAFKTIQPSYASSSFQNQNDGSQKSNQVIINPKIHRSDTHILPEHHEMLRSAIPVSSVRVEKKFSNALKPNERILELRQQLDRARQEREHTQSSRTNRSRSHSAMSGSGP